MTYRLKPWPRWLTLFEATGDIPAVRVLFAKPGRSLKREARRKARELMPEQAEGTDPDLLDLEAVGDAFTDEMLRSGILDWEGIGDAAGKVLKVSPEAIEMFLDDDRLRDRADQLYVVPEVMRDAEKNGLSVSPNGTGEAETPVNDTASSPARGRKKPGSDATNASTPSTRRKAPKGRKSGS